MYGNDPVARMLPVAQPSFISTFICTSLRDEDGGKYRHVGPEMHIWTDEFGHHRQVIRKKQRSTDADAEVFNDDIEDHDMDNYTDVLTDTFIEHKGDMIQN